MTRCFRINTLLWGLQQFKAHNLMCPTVYKRSDSFDNVLGKHEAKLKSESFKLAQNVKW